MASGAVTRHVPEAFAISPMTVVWSFMTSLLKTQHEIITYDAFGK